MGRLHERKEGEARKAVRLRPGQGGRHGRGRRRRQRGDLRGRLDIRQRLHRPVGRRAEANYDAERRHLPPLHQQEDDARDRQQLARREGEEADRQRAHLSPEVGRTSYGSYKEGQVDLVKFKFPPK